MYKKILFATDGCEHSKRAVENAIYIAKSNADSSMEIIYVINPKDVLSETLQNWNSGEIGSSRKKRIAEVEKLFYESGISYKVTILNGEPGSVIIKYINENEADLVILGSRKRNAIRELLLGSVSNEVARLAPCPVLIVK